MVKNLKFLNLTFIIMWSFSRQTTDSTSQNPAAGVCEDSNSFRISLRKFSGYSTEDPVWFLSDFDAYC